MPILAHTIYQDDGRNFFRCQIVLTISLNWNRTARKRSSLRGRRGGHPSDFSLSYFHCRKEICRANFIIQYFGQFLSGRE
jgi:hypothetical protein